MPFLYIKNKKVFCCFWKKIEDEKRRGEQLTGRIPVSWCAMMDDNGCFFLLSFLFIILKKVGGKTTSVVVLLPPPLDYTIHLIIYQVHQLCEIIKNVSITFAILFLNQSTFSNLDFTTPMESFLSSSLKYSREGWEKKNGSCQKKTIWKKKFWHVEIRSRVPPPLPPPLFNKKANGIISRAYPITKQKSDCGIAYILILYTTNQHLFP